MDNNFPNISLILPVEFGQVTLPLINDSNNIFLWHKSEDIKGAQSYLFNFPSNFWQF